MSIYAPEPEMDLANSNGEGTHSVDEQVIDLARQARRAAQVLATTSTDDKNRALLAIAEALRRNEEAILTANDADVEAAEEAGIPKPVVQRLKLRGSRFESMVKGVEEVAQLPDPVGEVMSTTVRPNGMEIRKVRVPLGVIGMIYEARPNVTVDAAVLCLKTGNAVLLKGGKEADRTNAVLAQVLREGLRDAGLPGDAVALVPGGRQGARAMMGAVGWIDVLIPRGGPELIHAVVRNARVPVIETGAGVCHVYVHTDADLNMAHNIVMNAKLSNPAVCNAVETLLVDRQVASGLLPRLVEDLQAAGVDLYGCEATRSIVPAVEPASEDDWAAEYLDLKLAIRIVDGLDDALEHIDRYGTGHSEAIVTANEDVANRFLNAVDACSVYWNVSTRFTDGGEFGFGAEIGISTQKLHARGPMGLPELTSYKYVIVGNGQIRS